MTNVAHFRSSPESLSRWRSDWIWNRQLFAAYKLANMENRAAFPIIPFSHWIPYAVAACLMALAITQARQIGALQSQLLVARADLKRLQASNAMIGLRLTMLEAKDAAYASSTIMVAWDPNQHQGILSVANLPTPPPNQDYQLWVLDPAAETPLNAGVIHASRSFAVAAVSTQNPGFAVSLEPGGGSPNPTGPILFAVAPGS